MRRLLVFGLVAAIALIGGIAVAGWPESVEDDIVLTEVPPPPTTSTTVLVTTAPAVAPETAATTSSATSTTASIAPPAATAAPATTAPAQGLRILVANASAADGLATRVAAEITALGYQIVQPTTAIENRPTTIIYFAPGHEAPAQRLAEQLGIALSEVQPRPEQQLTVSGQQSELLVLVGLDRI